MNYPKDPQKNREFRLNILEKSEEDPEVKGLLMERCKRDPLFFFNVFAWTYNPRVEPFDFPFITYDYQDEHILEKVECIEQEIDSIDEKSRDMGFSWDMVGLHVWAWNFRSWDSLYGSYKENYVDQQGNMDAFFERCRYMIYRLPKWMIPPDMIDKYMSISSKERGAEIAGDSGQNFGTGGRRKFVTLDEFALWQHADKAFRKTRDITNCRVIGGTPEGKYNIYGKIMTDHKDYKHLNIKKRTLHWTLHPEKGEGAYNSATMKKFENRQQAFDAWRVGIPVSSEWYEGEKSKRTKLDMAKELDISYEDSVTGAVYPGFSNIVTFGKFKFEAAFPLYTSWDFGRDMTSILWIQHDVKGGRHIVIDAFQKSSEDMSDILIDFFAGFITGQPVQGFEYTQEELDIIGKHKFWKDKYISHFGDPYNADSRTINTTSSVKDRLAKYGIHISTKAGTKLQDRINKTALGLKKLWVHDELYDYIMAMQQSKYPSLKETHENTTEKLKPIHNVYSHYRTAQEYYFDNEPAMAPVSDKYIRRLDKRLREQYMPGQKKVRPEYVGKI